MIKFILHGGYTSTDNEDNRTFYEEIARDVPNFGTVLLCYFASKDNDNSGRFNEEGKILLTRRGPNARNQVGKWEAPGGKVEFGETASQAIIREAKEELDIEIKIDALLGFVDDIIEKEKQHWTGPTWIASIIAGEPKIMEPDMCDGMGWFSIEEADQLEKNKYNKT